eukprot:12028654-Alexandrium_andersonii.AAC.1
MLLLRPSASSGSRTPATAAPARRDAAPRPLALPPRPTWARKDRLAHSAVAQLENDGGRGPARWAGAWWANARRTPDRWA